LAARRWPFSRSKPKGKRCTGDLVGAAVAPHLGNAGRATSRFKTIKYKVRKHEEATSATIERGFISGYSGGSGFICSQLGGNRRGALEVAARPKETVGGPDLSPPPMIHDVLVLEEIGIGQSPFALLGRWHQ